MKFFYEFRALVPLPIFTLVFLKGGNLSLLVRNPNKFKQKQIDFSFVYIFFHFNWFDWCAFAYMVKLSWHHDYILYILKSYLSHISKVDKST